MKSIGNLDTRERYGEYVGKGYYQKDIVVPKAWRDKQVRVQFDAVYETSKIWLNGELFGKLKPNQIQSILKLRD